ncbi:oligosaccharide flippase family protein [Alkalibacillus salilacus]|uniref:O-antigen/teichoic acid export membrane protein n=1 Tax=Alkalibacillus salilacus TaxID=284582 RepID=A0ABT9VHX0_9BACI|nr:oligosaccharide flippase family protein [Alkalibacillus salilacus]MDQ0160559.1 O-antigen/teichoic acid export membrane protein [Alkalibacillus salilacus]
MKDITRKAIHGFKWTGIKTLTNSLLQPIFRISLAILLTPSEYAYVAVILLIVSLTEMISNFGFGEFIVQKMRFNDKVFSSTIYAILLVNLVIISILYFIRGFISDYFSLSELDKIISLLLIVIIINSLAKISAFVLNREFLFKIEVIGKMSKYIIETLISLVLISVGLGIWGFVYGLLISNSVNLLINLHGIIKYASLKLTPILSLKHFENYRLFISQIGFKKILTFSGQKIDEVIIGGILTPDILGVYSFVKTLLIQIQSLITSSIGQVMLPLYSNFQNDNGELQKYYLIISYLLFLIAFPLFLLCSLTAKYLVPLLFDESWYKSIVIFEGLAIPIALIVLTSSVGTSLIYAKNKPGLLLSLELIMIPLYILSLVLLGNSLNMIIVLYSIFLILRFVIIQYFINKLIGLNMRRYVVNIKFPCLGLLTMLIIYKLINHLTINPPLIIMLIITILLLGFSYVVVVLLFERNRILNYLKLIRKGV